MPPTSIDGAQVGPVTIDGTEVQEITADGQVVYSAFPLIIQDFNTSLSNWDGTTSEISLDTTTVFEGASSMNATGNNDRAYTMNPPGTTFQNGDTFATWFRTDGGEPAFDGLHIYWGMKTDGDFNSAYEIRHRDGQLDASTPQGETLIDDGSPSGIQDNAWKRADIEWAENGDVIYYWRETDGTLIESFQGNDSNIADNVGGANGLGIRMGGGGQEFYDEWRVIDSTTR